MKKYFRFPLNIVVCSHITHRLCGEISCYANSETVHQALSLHHSFLYLYTTFTQTKCPHKYLQSNHEYISGAQTIFFLFDVSPECEHTQKVCLCMEINHVSLLPLLTLDRITPLPI